MWPEARCQVEARCAHLMSAAPLGEGCRSQDVLGRESTRLQGAHGARTEQLVYGTAANCELLYSVQCDCTTAGAPTAGLQPAHQLSLGAFHASENMIFSLDSLPSSNFEFNWLIKLIQKVFGRKRAGRKQGGFIFNFLKRILILTKVQFV